MLEDIEQMIQNAQQGDSEAKMSLVHLLKPIAEYFFGNLLVTKGSLIGIYSLQAMIRR